MTNTGYPKTRNAVGYKAVEKHATTRSVYQDTRMFTYAASRAVRKTGLASSLAVIVLGLATSVAKVPEDYILLITPDCGADSIEDATVKIITDLRAEAVGICANDVHVVFNTTDLVNLHLQVSYPGQGNSDCVFQKRLDSQVYVIKVYISWGEPGNPVHQNEEEFFVTCTYDEHGKKNSTAQTVSESLIAPVEIQHHLGDPAISTFSLTVCDVLGHVIDENSIPLGRIVHLTATTDGTNGEQGIRPVGCDAIGSLTGRRYAILRAGCGDGIVFKQYEGFITMGRKSVSPYFTTFDMAGDPSIQFECNFTLCNSSCDGSSCESERRRRSEPNIYGGKVQMVEGTLIFIEPESFPSPHLEVSTPPVEHVSSSPPLETSTPPSEDVSSPPPLETSIIPPEDWHESANDLIFWAALLGIGILSILTVSMSIFVYARRRSAFGSVPTE